MDRLFDNARSLREDYARVDWAATALGPVSDWSPELRAAVELTLDTHFAITLFWGPELVLVYNEAYRAMIGDKHPAALGARTRDAFPEVWDTIGPMLEGVLTGETVWMRNERLLLVRHGFAEETFFTFSYSPIRTARGEIVGAIDISTESTEQVRSLRRLATVTQLSEAMSRLVEPRELRELALPVLRTHGEDLVAVEIVSPDRPAQDPRLAGDREDDVFASKPVFRDTPHGTVAWLPLLGSGMSVPLQLVALLSPHVPLDDDYRAFLRLLASSLVMALERSRVREIERREAAASRTMSETFQRSLLAPPTVPAGYELAVRYRAAAVEAQVGGDWYDAFRLPDGIGTIVVGDVTGHDQASAVAMAQVRNLLRGVAYTVRQGPAGVLTALDEAMHGLRAQSLATAVVGQVGAHGDLTWSNAGHPPPVLIDADGTSQLLHTQPETLLGVHSERARTDHRLVLEPGSTIVLYTDGLIERRGETLDVSMVGLTEVLRDTQTETVDGICERLLDRYAASADDDVVLLVLRRRRDRG